MLGGWENNRTTLTAATRRDFTNCIYLLHLYFSFFTLFLWLNPQTSLQILFLGVASCCVPYQDFIIVAVNRNKVFYYPSQYFMRFYFWIHFTYKSHPENVPRVQKEFPCMMGMTILETSSFPSASLDNDYHSTSMLLVKVIRWLSLAIFM
jgi:hypothetical protein